MNRSTPSSPSRDSSPRAAASRTCWSRVSSSAALPAARCRSLRIRIRNSRASRRASASAREMPPAWARSGRFSAPKASRPSQRTSWMSRSPPGDRFTLGSSTKTVRPCLSASSRRASTSRSTCRRRPRASAFRSRCCSRRTGSSAPASRRQSSSELMIVASPPAKDTASPTVRTLWPTSSPASKRSCRSRLAMSATSGAILPLCRIIRSRSDQGAISARPQPPWATRDADRRTRSASPADRSAMIASQTSSTIASKSSVASTQTAQPWPPDSCCAAIRPRASAVAAAARATDGRNAAACSAIIRGPSSEVARHHG